MREVDEPGIAGTEQDDDLPRVLLAALEHTRASACITTADLDAPGPTIVYVNPAYCSMTGRSRTDVIGASPRIMQGPLTDRTELDRLRADLEAGRPFEGETVNYRADGTPFIINWRIDHIRDDDGTTTHFVATQEDVTEFGRAQRLLDAEQRLDDALTTALTSSLDADDARQLVIDTVARSASTIAGSGEVQVSAQIDGRAYASARVGGDRDPHPEAHGLAIVNPLERPEWGIGGAVELVGLDRHERDFVDEWGLARFCRRASTVLGALVEFQRQRHTALRLQRDLLPGPPTPVPGLDLATIYEPGALGAEVGGDWFDVSVSAGRVVASVGDVSGSGVDAAALMGRLRLLAAVEFGRAAETGDVFDLLDVVCEEAGQFATMLVVELSPATGEVTMWSAGHLPPIQTSDAGSMLVEVIPAPPLGHLGGSRPQPTTFHLADGAGLLLFTDGLVERRGESPEVGLGRLRDDVGHTTDPQEIMATLGRHLASVSDDVAALALRRNPTTLADEPASG